MKHFPLFLFLILSLLTACKPEQKSEDVTLKSTDDQNPATALIGEVIQTMGGIDRWKALKDIEYTYVYRNPSTGKQDVSLERYVYDGELSWARYSEHTQSLMPEQPGEVIQGFDGTTAWITYEGKLMTDPQYINRAHFSRKTNFYWLNMMYKLLDPGVHHELLEDQELRGQNYRRVKITFGEQVGDAQDTYLLYIDPDTHLVDYFLFTVMAFDRSEPLLTQVQYQKVDGLMFPALRRYAPSNWEGAIAEDANWIEAIAKDFKCNSGFPASLFQQPPQ